MWTRTNFNNYLSPFFTYTIYSCIECYFFYSIGNRFMNYEWAFFKAYMQSKKIRFRHVPRIRIKTYEEKTHYSEKTAFIARAVRTTTNMKLKAKSEKNISIRKGISNVESWSRNEIYSVKFFHEHCYEI